MYPALGYKPNDWQRLHDLNKFYQFCCDEDVPIITHGSAAGMYTHERALYFQFDRPGKPAYESIKATYELEQHSKPRFEQSWEDDDQRPS